MKRERQKMVDLFDSLPEGCISQILSYTSPRDVCSCRCSTLCKIFRSASEYDAIWERFLPPDYPEILAGSVSPAEFSSKKELCLRLCHSILIDEGKMIFSMEKMTCKKGYMLSARKLYIVWSWSEDPRYWKWSSLPESRFSEVAELLTVCWLEISGKIDCQILSPKTTYKAFLVYKLSEDAYGMDDAPAETLVKLGSYAFFHTVLLQPNHAPSAQSASFGHDVRAPEARSDGWMEVELGEFFNDEGEEGEIHMGLKEVKRLNWKKGLIIEGIEIRPV